MYIYLDESGDPGFKFEHGSSSHFIIALAVFADQLDAEDTALRIKRLRQSLGLKESFEFKFNKMSNAHRYQFMTAVREAPFSIRALVVDKRGFQNNPLVGRKDTFYQHFVAQLLAWNSAAIRNATLRVDGQGEREFKKAFQSNLRQSIAAGALKKLTFVNSKGDNLIQLADMLAGSIARKYNPRHRDPSYLNPLNARIANIWEI